MSSLLRGKVSHIFYRAPSQCAKIVDFWPMMDSGVAEVSINKWEEENAPYKMPDDFKAFLQISDGLSLNWKIKKNEMLFNLG